MCIIVFLCNKKIIFLCPAIKYKRFKPIVCDLPTLRVKLTCAFHCRNKCIHVKEMTYTNIDKFPESIKGREVFLMYSTDFLERYLFATKDLFPREYSLKEIADCFACMRTYSYDPFAEYEDRVVFISQDNLRSFLIYSLSLSSCDNVYESPLVVVQVSTTCSFVSGGSTCLVGIYIFSLWNI